MSLSVLFSVLLTATLSPLPQAPSVAGEWDATYNTPGGPRNFKIVFQVKGDSLLGTVKRDDGDVPLKGTIDKDQINFSYTIIYNDHPITLTIAAKVTGDSMAGTVDFGGMGGDDFSARRSKPPQGGTLLQGVGP